MKRPGLIKPMEWALFYLKFRPRSIGETKRYLQQKARKFTWPDDEVEQTIARLIELSLLDDVDFAQRFVASQTNRKLKGKRWFVQKLSMAGVSPDIIESTLQDPEKTDGSKALEILKMKFGDQENLDRSTIAKAQRLLLSRGFSWSDISSALASWRKKE